MSGNIVGSRRICVPLSPSCLSVEDLIDDVGNISSELFTPQIRNL